MKFLCIQNVYLLRLFFVGNEISKVEGLEALQELRELVLDRNKIKVIIIIVLTEGDTC